MDPEFIKNAALIASAFVAALIGVFKYIKTDGKSSDKPISSTEQVMAATFIDSKLLRDLIDTLRTHAEEYGRESRKMNRNRQELSTALEESTDALLSNTDAMINMLRFLRRERAETDDA